MTVDERRNTMSNTNIIQNVILENREKLNISGVLDVLSFDTSEVIIEGEMNALTYSEKDLDKKSGSLLGKLFK